MGTKRAGTRLNARKDSKGAKGTAAQATPRATLRSAAAGPSGKMKSASARKSHAIAKKATIPERKVGQKVRIEGSVSAKSPSAVQRVKRVATSVVEQAAQGAQRIGEMVSTVANEVVHRVN